MGTESTKTSGKTGPSVLIVGAGFGGVGTAIELKRAGIDDFTILESAAEPGGVWRENTYPGAGCDIPSPLYSFSYEPNPDWPKRFSLQPDIHKDPVLRAKLTPDYPMGCKRILFTNDYLPALAQHNVAVETGRITEITPNGVRTEDGVKHEADVLIYGTGFAATDFLGDLKVQGLGGRSLSDAWSGGARAYLGITVPGFPNLFCVYGPNTNLGAGSIIYMIERQARYIRQAVEHLARPEVSYMDVLPEVEQRYDDEVQRRLAGSVWTTCASWYRQDNGRVTTNWPGLVTEYDRRTRRLDLGDYRTTGVA